jgi:DNA-binding SARP family transcriptional activator
LLEIRMLGPLEVAGGEKTLGPGGLGGSKVKKVLEILLVARGRAVPKERLAELVWGDRLPQNYLRTLESYVSVLRKRLDPNRGPRDSVVITEPGAYRLALAKVTVDIDTFDLLVLTAERDSSPHGLALLCEAVGLVRGELLEDEPYSDWVRPLREAYQRKVVEVLVRAATLSLDLGDLRQALALADRAIATDEWAEGAYRAQMLALYRLGNREEAARAYERCRHALDVGLGVEPMEETRRLQAAIHARHAPLPPNCADAAHLQPLIGQALASGVSVLLLDDGSVGESPLVAAAAALRALEHTVAAQRPPAATGVGTAEPSRVLIDGVPAQIWQLTASVRFIEPVGSTRAGGLSPARPAVAIIAKVLPTPVGDHLSSERKWCAPGAA